MFCCLIRAVSGNIYRGYKVEWHTGDLVLLTPYGANKKASGCYNLGHRSKRILNHELANSHRPIIYCSVVKSFWICLQRTAVSLPCSMQIFGMIKLLKSFLWSCEISGDFSLRRVSDRYPILQWLSWSHFNSSPPSAAYLRQWIGSALVKIMACRLFGAKPSKPILGYCQLDT